MKIGIYLRSMPATAGGGFTFESSVLDAVHKYKGRHEFYVFTESPVSPKSRALTPSVKYIPLKRSESSGIPGEPAETNKHQSNSLNTALIKYKIDIVLFINPFSFQPVITPYIYVVWDLQHRLQPYFPEVSVTGTTWDQRESLYKAAIPKAAYIITGNSVGKKEISKFYNIPEKRIRIIPFAVHDVFVKQKDEKAQDLLIDNRIVENFLFYPANFWPHKNHICILLAMTILKIKYGIRFKVIFTGRDSGNFAYIRAKAKELGLESAIHYSGFVSTEILCSLYKKAFALVYPSFFGPNNLPPLEAMTLGCPVICSDADGMKEQLGNSAIFFDPKREDELAEKIYQLYSNAEERIRLVEAGKKGALNWTQDDYLSSILDIVEDFEPYKRCWDLFLEK